MHYCQLGEGIYVDFPKCFFIMVSTFIGGLKPITCLNSSEKSRDMVFKVCQSILSRTGDRENLTKITVFSNAPRLIGYKRRGLPNISRQCTFFQKTSRGVDFSFPQSLLMRYKLLQIHNKIGLQFTMLTEKTKKQ